MSPRLQKRWGWLLLGFPLIGLVELTAHVVQCKNALAESDFVRAERAAGGLATDDAVVFAPRWTEQLGRKAFADYTRADLARAAPPDLARFHHVLEVSARGDREPDVAGWPVQWERKVGKLTLRMLENGAFNGSEDDLLDRMGTARLTVTQNGRDCALQKGAASASGWSLPTPATRYACGSGAVGVVVVPDLAYRLRQCLLVPATALPTRLRFLDVSFGSALRFAHGLHTEGERALTGAPVTTRVLVQTDGPTGEPRDVELGTNVHTDGQGWVTFEVPTPSLRGQIGDLYVEISAPGGHRPYCISGFAR